MGDTLEKKIKKGFCVGDWKLTHGIRWRSKSVKEVVSRRIPLYVKKKQLVWKSSKIENQLNYVSEVGSPINAWGFPLHKAMSKFSYEVHLMAVKCLPLIDSAKYCGALLWLHPAVWKIMNLLKILSWGILLRCYLENLLAMARISDPVNGHPYNNLINNVIEFLSQSLICKHFVPVVDCLHLAKNPGVLSNQENSARHSKVCHCLCA